MNENKLLDLIVQYFKKFNINDAINKLYYYSDNTVHAYCNFKNNISEVYNLYNVISINYNRNSSIIALNWKEYSTELSDDEVFQLSITEPTMKYYSFLKNMDELYIHANISLTFHIPEITDLVIAKLENYINDN